MRTVANVMESWPLFGELKDLNAPGVVVGSVTADAPAVTVAVTGAADVSTVPEVMVSSTTDGLALSLTSPLRVIVVPAVAMPEALVNMIPLSKMPPLNASIAAVLPIAADRVVPVSEQLDKRILSTSAVVEAHPEYVDRNVAGVAGVLIR